MKPLQSNCAGIPRRDFLQIGLGAMGGLGLGNLMQARAATAKAAGKSPDDVRCILVWLDGGPLKKEAKNLLSAISESVAHGFSAERYHRSAIERLLQAHDDTDRKSVV